MYLFEGGILFGAKYLHFKRRNKRGTEILA
jgi:hypothetical protein